VVLLSALAATVAFESGARAFVVLLSALAATVAFESGARAFVVSVVAVDDRSFRSSRATTVFNHGGARGVHQR
jgi:hypothetical protein